MADGATMRPAAPVRASANAATSSGPTIDMTYDAPVGYDVRGLGYDAATFTPGAPAMTPA